MEQWVEHFCRDTRRHLASLTSRGSQFVRKNPTASALAGLFVASLLCGAFVLTWLVHRADMANTKLSSDDALRMAQKRVNNSFDDQNALARGARTDALTSDVRRDQTARTNVMSTIEEYRGAELQDHEIVPASYVETVADVPRDRNNRGNVPSTYPHPGGVLFLTSADPVVLGPYAGDYLVLINKPQAALEAFRNRLAIDERAVAADPGNLQVQSDLAYSSSRIGDLLADMGDETGALPYYQKAVDVYTKNSEASPQDLSVPLQLSRVLAKLAKTHTRLGYIEKATAEANKAADLLHSLPDDPANVEQRRTRASAYREIGDAYAQLASDTRTPQPLMKKFWAAAREMYDHSFTILIILRDKGLSTPDELSDIDELVHKIAECDLFLAK